VALVIGTLTRSNRMTGPGDIFVAGMARTLHSWAAEPVPSDAAALARKAADLHRARWQRHNGEITAKVSAPS
jgi:hypothetical protein